MSNLLSFTVVIQFFLKNPLCHFKPPGACYKGLLYFKISGRPRPGQDVYFLNLTFWSFGGPMGQGPWARAREAAIAADWKWGVWGGGAPPRKIKNHELNQVGISLVDEVRNSLRSTGQK